MSDALADLAAGAWGGRLVRLIARRENAVYEMALPGGRAALRLHRPGYQDAEAIRSELWWCAALAEAGVRVPAPLPSLAGDHLHRLPDGRLASAIAWVDGAALGEGGIRRAMPVAELIDCYHRLGQLVAGFHAATDRLALPSGFTRPRWGLEDLVGEAPRWDRFWEHPRAEPAQAETLCRARGFLRDWLTAYARDGDFGLIHADVLRENVLVGPDGLTLIDFDDSGFGFRGYDLGTAMIQNFDEPAQAAIRDALVAGYAETRPMTAEVVEVFTLARACASVGWTMPRLDPAEPVCASHIARAITCARRLGV